MHLRHPRASKAAMLCGERLRLLSRLCRGSRLSCVNSQKSKHRSFQHCIMLCTRRGATTLASTQAPISHRLASATSIFDSGEFDSVHLPYGKDRGKPEAWLNIIEPLLPEFLRLNPEKGGSASSSTAPPLNALIIVLVEARNQSGIDLLSHLHLKQGRADAMLWLSDVLIKWSAASRPSTDDLLDFSLSSMPWPAKLSLDVITGDEAKTHFDPAYAPENQPMAGSSRIPSLNDATKNQTPGSGRMIKSNFVHEAIGLVWQALGSMLVAAPYRGKDGSRSITANVISVLSRMQQQGHFPQEIFGIPLLDETRALQRPPLLHFYSSNILSALASATYAESEPSQNGSSHEIPGFFLKTHQPPLGLSLWLELVLWCCVHGRWYKEGTAILNEMRGRPLNDRKWSLVSWYDASRIPGPIQNSKGDGAISIGYGDEGFNFDHKLGSEVVVAIIDGLASSMSFDKEGERGYTPSAVLDRISILKSVLEDSRMSLGVLPWEAIVSHFAELPNYSLREQPALMNNVLSSLVESFGREPSSANVRSMEENDSEFSDYVFSGTAAALGLYHRILHAHIQNRDVNKSLRIFANLQTLTDKNKEKSLKDFFGTLKQRKISSLKKGTNKSVAFDYSTDFTPLEYPSFYPRLPTPILAALLDLVRESGATEVGSWMVQAEEVDGPLIPPSLYTDQVMAPALIRFAAETRDRELLANVTKAQDVNVSGKTLLALCESRVEQKNWKGAIEVLKLMSEHSLHQWTSLDFAIMIKSLIQYIGGNSDAKSSQYASVILQKLLRGDLGQIWGPEFKQLDSIVGILSGVSPNLAGLCSNLLSLGQTVNVDLPAISFNTILDGVVKAYGSSEGQRLFETWCRSSLSTQSIAILDASGSSNSTSNISELFSRPPQASNQRSGVSFTGYITPEISTIRTIVQKALRELRSNSPESERKGREQDGHQDAISFEEGKTSKSSGRNLETHTKAREVLEWAADIYRDRFNLRPVDIQYELESEIPIPDSTAVEPARESLYSKDTLGMYARLASNPSSHLKALKMEERLRAFITELNSPKTKSNNTRSLIFDSILSSERKLLHCLVTDYGGLRYKSTHAPDWTPLNNAKDAVVSEALVSQSLGNDHKRARGPVVPSLTVGEVFKMQRRASSMG